MRTPSPLTSGSIFADRESIVAVTRTVFFSHPTTSMRPERLRSWRRMFGCAG
ncbi:MAG TPA: hypothetical protein VF611_14335 [Pyrinomonadaceae bacterium]